MRLLFEGGSYSRAALNSIFSKFVVKLTNLVAKFAYFEGFLKGAALN